MGIEIKIITRRTGIEVEGRRGLGLPFIES